MGWFGRVDKKYRILVISSCTKKKLKQKSGKEFDKKNKGFSSKESLIPAYQLYRGRHHLYLMEGIGLLRDNFEEGIVSLKILSAGYGLIDENKKIAPYDKSLNKMGKNQIIEWGRKQQIKKKLCEMAKDFNIIVFLLGNKYLQAIDFPMFREDQKVIFFSSAEGGKIIPEKNNYFLFYAGVKEAGIFKASPIWFKGYLFKLICKEVIKNPDLLNRIYYDPIGVMEKFYKNQIFKKKTLFNNPKIELPKKIYRVKGEAFPNLIVKGAEFADNYRAGKEMKFFIPEWDDRVDPNYDFLKDETNRKNGDPYEDDFYSHEIYDSPNYDGILMSLSVLSNEKIKGILSKENVHNFLRFPKKFPIMADCGAFNYIDERMPPFSIEDALNYYQSLGFDYGVSIDHLIVGKYGKDPKERNRRYELTQENARLFLKNHREKGCSFKPIGIAQGWDPQSYFESAKELINLGYKYIALGSLIPKKTQEIFNILKRIAPIIPEDLDLHLFGVARLEGIKAFHQLGATSFDSASPLRRAWLGVAQNYFSFENDEKAADGIKKYAAIRVPYHKAIKTSQEITKELEGLEKRALTSLRKFGVRNENLEKVIEDVLTYEKAFREEKLISKKGYDEKAKIDLKKQIEKHDELYREVLEIRPWENCDCKICKEIGIDVVIFRGNNRNRRRGFHNTYVFNKKMRKIIR